MPIDPLVSLAFAIHSSPGAYAVLIGSGLSSAAGIPTGWAIVLDLIRRVAAVSGADPGKDPEGWYVKEFGEEPEYSTLLDHLAKTQVERQAIVRHYIEPTEQDRDSNLRVPTAAHHAIARLVAGGNIRVVMTTNFDSLLEKALDDQGISYDLIASLDALAGARPLALSPCTVIKLHGDYRDARIRNTPVELDTYEPGMDALLDRVLEEHGLLICGWSASWDTALRRALLRQPVRRYATFWALHGVLSEEAKDLIRHRQAQVIEGYDGDRLFERLEGKVSALADVERSHPLTVATAVAELKRYLPDPRSRIRLDDLVMGEAVRVVNQLAATAAAPSSPDPVEQARRRVARLEAAVDILAPLLSTGCTYSENPEQDRLWARALGLLASNRDSQPGVAAPETLDRYPALLCFYAGGVAALAASKWITLRAIALDAEALRPTGSSIPLAAALHPGSVFEGMDTRAVLAPDGAGVQDPTLVSDHIREQLRTSLRLVIPTDAMYAEAFDRFEFLLGMMLADFNAHPPLGDPWVPLVHVGSYSRQYRDQPHSAPAMWVERQLQHPGEWPVLHAGLFGKDPRRAEQALRRTDETAERWVS